MPTEKRTWLIVGLGMAVLAGIVLSIGIGFWRPDPRETPSADARPLQRPVALEEPVEPPTPIAWTKITEPGHFSVMFPGMPERLTGNSLDGPVGSYTFQRHGGREMFLVNWNDLPPASAAVE